MNQNNIDNTYLKLNLSEEDLFHLEKVVKNSNQYVEIAKNNYFHAKIIKEDCLKTFKQITDFKIVDKKIKLK